MFFKIASTDKYSSVHLSNKTKFLLLFSTSSVFTFATNSCSEKIIITFITLLIMGLGTYLKFKNDVIATFRAFKHPDS